MSDITAAMVKQLRDQTGAGMMDVKRALTEANGNMDEATKILRKKGLAAATKKAGRITSEGAVHGYAAGNIGVLVEVNCETDFVARTDQFRQFVDDVAKLIAKSKSTTVDQLLDFSSAPADTEPAFLTDGSVQDWEKEYKLQQWWLDRMATTTTPLQEKLTLVWHGHFATANYKVADMLLMVLTYAPPGKPR